MPTAPSAISAARCLSPGALTPFELHAGSARLPAAAVGAGSTVLVTLHQTDGFGGCGWLPAGRLIAAKGLRVVVFDMCGYGRAECTGVVPPATQVAAAVTWARVHGARRVVLAGASMGGSIALGTAAGAKVDAIADLSGPISWDQVPDAPVAARTLRIPLLGAASADDTDSDAAALQRAVLSSPGRHRYIAAPSGHGWDMLATTGTSGKTTPTTLLGTVVQWIKSVTSS